MNISEERSRVLRSNSAAKHTETVSCIKNALLALMEQKEYDAISMTDVIRKSGMSRAGVYYNFKNKDEILLDIVQNPINESIAGLTDSIFNNMEVIFRTGKKYESYVKAVIVAGLEQEYLNRLNQRFEDVTMSFYLALWNGMIYNAFIEWARAGMPGTVEGTIDQVIAALKLVSTSIETGLVQQNTSRAAENRRRA